MGREFQITFDASDPIAQARFWAEALGYVVPSPPHRAVAPGEDSFDAWAEFHEWSDVPQEQRDAASAVVDPKGIGPRLLFQRVPESKTVKNRIHLDLHAAPGLEGQERMAALEVECERLVALGGARLHRHEPAPNKSAGFIVMADPDGNEFCVD